MDQLWQALLCDTQVATMVAQVAVTGLMFYVAVTSFFAVTGQTKKESDTLSDLSFAQKSYSEQTKRNETEHKRLVAQLRAIDQDTHRMAEEVELTRQRCRDATQLTADVIARNEELADAMDAIGARADQMVAFYEARKEAVEHESDEIFAGVEELEEQCEAVKCKTELFHTECVKVAEALQARLPADGDAAFDVAAAGEDEAAEDERSDGADSDEMLDDPALVDGVSLEARYQALKKGNGHLLAEVDRVWNKELDGLQRAIKANGKDIHALHGQVELLRHRDELKETAAALRERIGEVADEVAATTDAIEAVSAQRLRERRDAPTAEAAVPAGWAAADKENTPLARRTPAKKAGLTPARTPQHFGPPNTLLGADAKTPTPTKFGPPSMLAGCGMFSPGGNTFCSPTANIAATA